MSGASWSPRVKVCGIRTLEDGLLAAEAGVDAVGFNFVPTSPRYVHPAEAARISRALPRTIWKVGVFVDTPRERIEEIARVVSLDALQFHGNEPLEALRGWSVPVIRAVRVRHTRDVEEALASGADFVLADTYFPASAGGTGRTFDWSLLESVDRSRLFVAGGLDPENVVALVRRLRPYGVDVASGVEKAPGVKDPEKLRRFVRNAKAA
ncbi:MAG: N-(5'-phosphoribosyl)anthranilate isomerase [Candidatus Binatia bacterium]|nr:MAG: N-(5'-phosphoribosyl)anthranilate isomerase [Candidatus Binatia bacterium]